MGLGVGLEKAALEVIASGAFFEALDFADELPDVFELAVDGDVADVGDRVDLVEFVHDLGTDDVGGDFGEVVAVEFGEDFFDGAVEAVHGDGAFFAGLDEAAHEFFAMDGLACAVAFDDAEFGAFDLFVGGVAVGAAEALAAAADGGAVLRHSGVEDLIFERAALNAPHLGEQDEGRNLQVVSSI